MKLIWTFFQFKAFQFLEFLKVVGRFYRYPKFALADLFLLSLYLLQNPFRISKSFLKKQGVKEIHIYGETPLTSFEAISEEVEKGDTVFELGAGRGRCSLFLALIKGVEVYAVEQIPSFAKRLRLVKNLFKISNLHVVEDDYLNLDFSKSNFIYLYASDLPDDKIQKLIKSFESSKKGSLVATVSFPLNAYDQKGIFSLQKKMGALFPWGVGEVYFQVRR